MASRTELETGFAPRTRSTTPQLIDDAVLTELVTRSIGNVRAR